MKINKPLLSFLLVLFISLVACHKTGENGIEGDNTSISGVPLITPDREYFWGLGWTRTSRGDEINLNIPRLVDSVIIKGVDIGLAVYSDWDPFEKIPFEYHDTHKNDTIHVSYEVIPGHLKIIATAPFEITYPSDVYIQYN